MAMIAGDNVRRSFARARRCLIKVGSNVLTNDEGRLAIGRIGELVEQIARLVSYDRKEVILVSSGAVAVGTRRLSFQRRLSSTLLQAERLQKPSTRAAASAGQAMFMSLYEQMFAQFDLTVGNVLVTHSDFASQEHVTTLASTIDELLASSIIPVINENDVTNQILKDRPMWFKDNDSLSAKLASDFDAQLLLLLTDVPGVYTAAPGEKGAYLLDYYSPAIDQIKFGEKSSRGRGGMESKMHAALLASQKGVDVVIASGNEPRVIDRIFRGEVLGTVFTQKWDQQGLVPRQICVRSKEAFQRVQTLKGSERSEVLKRFAKALVDSKQRILDANAEDVAAFVHHARDKDRDSSAADEPEGRMILNAARIDSLSRSVLHLANEPDPIGQTLEQRELTDGLLLRQETVPLGVVLCASENTADVLVQVAAICMRTANSLILYDNGDGLRRTHTAILQVIQAVTRDFYPAEAVQVCGPDTDIKRMLNLEEDFVDIILLRGAPPPLRKRLTRMTHIPVIGHGGCPACHVYVDKSADLEKAIEVIIDSKLQCVGPGCNDTPTYLASNALDVLLVHQDLLQSRAVLQLVQSLTEHGVTLHGGPRAAKELGIQEEPDLSTAWGNALHCTVEIVEDVHAAVSIINAMGGGVSDALVAEDSEVVDLFMKNVDSACLFHNASTRFADGWRLGLGAETGITTRHVPSRGPVGLKGLLSTKWQVVSQGAHTLKQFRDGKWTFSHRDISPAEAEALQQQQGGAKVARTGKKAAAPTPASA